MAFPPTQDLIKALILKLSLELEVCVHKSRMLNRSISKGKGILPKKNRCHRCFHCWKYQGGRISPSSFSPGTLWFQVAAQTPKQATRRWHERPRNHSAVQPFHKLSTSVSFIFSKMKENRVPILWTALQVVETKSSSWRGNCGSQKHLPFLYFNFFLSRTPFHTKELSPLLMSSGSAVFEQWTEAMLPFWWVVC